MHQGACDARGLRSPLLISLQTHTCHNWLQLLLVLWRAWYLRNDIIHQEGKALVAALVSFLLAYQRGAILSPTYTDEPKGKCALMTTSYAGPGGQVCNMCGPHRAPNFRGPRISVSSLGLGVHLDVLPLAVARSGGFPGSFGAEQCIPLSSPLESVKGENRH
jgi:hypothetical protein